MGYNSKKKKNNNKELWQKFFNLEVDQTFRKVCAKNNQNWESYEQKETTYFRGAFLQVPPLK